MSYNRTIRVAAGSNLDVLLPLVSTLDGVSLNAGDEILLVNQTDSTQNGVWRYQGATTALTRPPSGAPFASGSSIEDGTVVPIGPEGTQFGNQKWAVNNLTVGSITVDTTPIRFVIDALGPAGPATITLTNGMNSAVNGGKYDYLEVAPEGLTSAFQISGFSDTVPGLERVIFNPTLLPMTLKHEDSTDEPTAANRIHNPDGSDVVCTLATLRYSPALQRWLVESFEPAWSPLQMRGITAWWRSDAVTLDASGNVHRAIDLTGNGFAASQEDPSARPAFSPNGGPNGRSFWTCDASTHLDNTTTNLLPSGQDHTVFAAFEPTGLGGSIITLRCTAPINWLGYQDIGGLIYVYTDGVNATNNATIPTMTSGIPVVATATSRVGSLMSLRINGTPTALTSGGVEASETGLAGFTLLGRLDTVGYGFTGRFYELFVLDHAATDAEIAVAEAYLTRRWG